MSIRHKVDVVIFWNGHGLSADGDHWHVRHTRCGYFHPDSESAGLSYMEAVNAMNRAFGDPDVASVNIVFNGCHDQARAALARRLQKAPLNAHWVDAA